MARVLTFSRVFPKYHPKAGQDTFFVEKILSGILPKQQNGLIDLNELPESVAGIVNDFQLLCSPAERKCHTIRAGNRWKVGDKFSPRVWSGKPYCSKQITIAPDIEIKKVWDVEIQPFGSHFFVLLPTKKQGEYTMLSAGDVAENDGLNVHDFIDWFKGHKKKVNDVFKGQIICWNETINY